MFDESGVSLKRGVEASHHAPLLINCATAHARVGKTHHVASVNPLFYRPIALPLILSCISRSTIAALLLRWSCLATPVLTSLPCLRSCPVLPQATSGPPLPSSCGMAGKGTITTYFGNGSSVASGGDSEQPAMKRPRKEDTSADTSGHVVGYNKSWETEFPWLVPIYAEVEEKVSGILCSLCKRHSTKNKYNRSTKCVSSERLCQTPL